MKHKWRWTYSTRDFKILLCPLPPMRSCLWGLGSLNDLLMDKMNINPIFYLHGKIFFCLHFSKNPYVGPLLIELKMIGLNNFN